MIFGKNNSFLLKILSIFLLFAIWFISSSLLNLETLPSPVKVFFKLKKDLLNGNILYHLSITLYRVLVSFLLAMFIGIILGILMGNNKKINNLLDSWNIIFLNIPALVLIILSYVYLCSLQFFRQILLQLFFDHFFQQRLLN